MRALLEEAGRIAHFDVPVLIEGETGSGKELIARYLHARSRRRRQPLVAVNCGALPDELLEAEFFGHARGAFTGADSARPGLLEAADGGTLFLDEVGEMSPRGQGLLLRALQEREFRRVGEIRLRRSDFRLVAATHRPLAELAAAGRFRSDLFYRLSVVRLRLPPLRERKDEFPELAAALLSRLAKRHGLPLPRLSDEALAVLARRDWPGNVRELESVLAGALLRQPEVTAIRPEMVAGRRRSRSLAIPLRLPQSPSFRSWKSADWLSRERPSSGLCCCARFAAPPEAAPAPRGNWASRARGCGRNFADTGSGRGVGLPGDVRVVGSTRFR